MSIIRRRLCCKIDLKILPTYNNNKFIIPTYKMDLLS